MESRSASRAGSTARRPWRLRRKESVFMTRSINEVRVVGLGKVGELVALLLSDSGFTVTAYDSRTRSDLPFACKELDVRDGVGLRAALTGADAVVSCLPYNLNLGVA